MPPVPDNVYETPSILATNPEHDIVGSAPLTGDTTQLVIRLRPAAYVLGTAVGLNNEPLEGVLRSLLDPQGGRSPGRWSWPVTPQRRVHRG